jgi:hypothetical protein
VAAIGAYLSEVYREATRRGYHFDVERVHRFSPRVRASIPVTRGQLAYEQAHLAAKLKKRSRDPEGVGEGREIASPSLVPRSERGR